MALASIVQALGWEVGDARKRPWLSKPVVDATRKEGIMKALRALLAVAWGAFFLFPIFPQEIHLRILAATGTVEEIKEALKNSTEITKADFNGVSALMLAASSNRDPAVIALLVSAGADLNARSVTGETALFYAAESNPNPGAVLALLKAGASLDDRDGLGRTPLMAAAWGNSNPAVISALLKVGADAKAKNYLGKTALDYARENLAFSPDEGVCRALEEAIK
jgi:RNase P/RNase MRP subunit POP5